MLGFVGILIADDGLLWAILDHFVELVREIARETLEFSDLPFRIVIALEHIIPIRNVLPTGGIGEHIPGIDPGLSWAQHVLDDDLQFAPLTFPGHHVGLGRRVRSLQDAHAEPSGVKDHLADFAMMLTLDHPVIDPGLGLFGRILRLVHGLFNKVVDGQRALWGCTGWPRGSPRLPFRGAVRRRGHSHRRRRSSLLLGHHPHHGGPILVGHRGVLTHSRNQIGDRGRIKTEGFVIDGKEDLADLGRSRIHIPGGQSDKGCRSEFGLAMGDAVGFDGGIHRGGFGPSLARMLRTIHVIDAGVGFLTHFPRRLHSRRHPVRESLLLSF